MKCLSGRRALFGGVLLVAIIGLAVLPHGAFAQTDDLSSVADTAGYGEASITEIIGRVIGVALSLLGIIFLILIIYSGYLWMTAGGDPKQVDKAKQVLINATVGLVITLSAYAISAFVFNMLTDGGFGDGDGDGGDSNGDVTVERFSNALGSGSIRDHFPERNDTDVARNTRIMVTFKEAMDIESFIAGYDTSGTAEDVSDDIVATAINSERVLIYKTASGEGAALTAVQVTFTEDLKTFVFNPDQNLGSATEDTSYTVALSDGMLNAEGEEVFDEGGYVWSFEVGTEIDVTPPSVYSVTPVQGATKDRNVTVQMTFTEALDPTTASGVRSSGSGFSNIQASGASTGTVDGTYEISNGYKTVTFTPADACGENSCDETIYCLPASQLITVTAYAATVSSTEPPQASAADGITDTSGNSLDANDDGTAGDDKTWSFTTTSDVNRDAPVLETITPDLSASEVDLDQDVQLTFDSILMGSSLDTGMTLTNKEMSSGLPHEMWYAIRTSELTSNDVEVTDYTTQTPAKTRLEILHGTFLESVDGLSYMYGVTAGSSVKNEYQNCFAPGMGPLSDQVSCDPESSSTCCAVTDDAPYCCDGVASSTACSLF